VQIEGGETKSLREGTTTGKYSIWAIRRFIQQKLPGAIMIGPKSLISLRRVSKNWFCSEVNGREASFVDKKQTEQVSNVE